MKESKQVKNAMSDKEMQEQIKALKYPTFNGKPLANKYMLKFYIAVTNGNPNGNPDSANLPRIDPETNHGLITDVSIKRRIRDYILERFDGVAGLDVFAQCGTNANRFSAEVCKENDIEFEGFQKEEEQGKDATSENKESKKEKSKEGTLLKTLKFRNALCKRFWDIRTFGGVMCQGAGLPGCTLQGPVQISIAKSLSPVYINNLSIVRTNAPPSKQRLHSLDDYLKDEQNSPSSDFQTFGRKPTVAFGLYECTVHVMPSNSAKTGFTEEDFEKLLEAICNMYEFRRSAALGETSVVSPIILFKHVGTHANAEERAKQALLGAGVSAQKLAEAVSVTLKDGIEEPRSYRDYEATIDFGKIPAGVEIGFKQGAYDDVVWGKLPENEDWFSAKN